MGIVTIYQTPVIACNCVNYNYCLIKAVKATQNWKKTDKSQLKLIKADKSSERQKEQKNWIKADKGRKSR